jgi:hypothetical protein
MTNVVELRPGRPGDPTAAAALRSDAVLVGLLNGMIERIEGVGAQVALLNRSPLQIERTVQALLDAATALEQAADMLTDGRESR